VYLSRALISPTALNRMLRGMLMALRRLGDPVESGLYVVSGQLGAVAELHALAQEEGIGLAVLSDLPAVRQIGNDGFAAVARVAADQVVEHASHRAEIEDRAGLVEVEMRRPAGRRDGIKGLDFMVREIAIFKLWSQAIQAMLKESLNIECNLRTVVDSVWFADAASGNYDLAIGGLVSALLDPSDYFNAWYGKDGPQNYSLWSNQEFQALSAQIDREIDAEKRQDLIRRAEAIMEQDPPLLPVAWERIHELWYSYVKGRNPQDSFGIYDTVRHDTVWLDKA
jgi:hypothetical protein